MSTNYPGALDNTSVLKNDAVNATLTETTHPAHHNNLSDAVIAVETELGINPSGSYTTVADAVLALHPGTGSVVVKAPTADQIVLPTADKINLALRAFNAGQTSKVMEVRNAAGTVVAYFDKLGALSAASLAVSGTALAASHLSNGVLGTGAIVLGTSATLTTPTLTNPTVTTGTFSSPALTGTPTAPTPTVGDDSTKIATTAFVQDTVGGSTAIPTGTILEYAGAAAPSGFLLCDGSAINRITYAALFGVISTAYGSGDGINTFNLPDHRGRMPVGKGTHADVDTLGDTEGEATVGNRRPAHKHTTTHSTDGSHTHTGSTASSGAHTHTYQAVIGTTNFQPHTTPGFSSTTSATTGSSGAHTHTMSLDAAGSHTHTITVGPQSSSPLDAPGFLVANFIIKT